MPLDKFVLIIVCVVIAAAATIWVGALIFAAIDIPFVGIALIPVALVGYVVVRVIAQRVGNRQDDHYDKMDH